MTLLEAILSKHYGPGAHPSGSKQTVHAGSGDENTSRAGFDENAYGPKTYTVYRATGLHGGEQAKAEWGEMEPYLSDAGPPPRTLIVTTSRLLASDWAERHGGEVIRIEIPVDELTDSLKPGHVYRRAHGAYGKTTMVHVARRNLTDEGKYRPVSKREWMVELLKHTPGGTDHDQKRHGRRGGAAASGDEKASGVSESVQTERRSQNAGPPATGERRAQGQLPGMESPSQDPGGESRREQALAVSKPPPENAALVRQMTDDAMMKYGARISHITAVAGMDQMSVEGQRIGIDTYGTNSNWTADLLWDGFKPERATWQTSVLAEMEAAQIAANDGRVPKNEKQVIIMAGLPGSGKTHLLENFLQERFELRDYVVVNADKIKEKIIFEDAPPEIGDLEGMELSSMAHEESSAMSKDWERTLIARGANIALDITAANRTGTLKRIAALKDQGYTVHVVHSDINIDEAIASTMTRAGEGATTPGKVGRPVPPDFIRSMDSGDGGDSIDHAFYDYIEQANGQVAWYRNYPLSRQDPVLVYSSDGPQEQTIEEAAAA